MKEQLGLDDLPAGIYAMDTKPALSQCLVDHCSGDVSHSSVFALTTTSGRFEVSQLAPQASRLGDAS